MRGGQKRGLVWTLGTQTKVGRLNCRNVALLAGASQGPGVDAQLPQTAKEAHGIAQSAGPLLKRLMGGAQGHACSTERDSSSAPRACGHPAALAAAPGEKFDPRPKSNRKQASF